jgi:hypothetical protein
MPILHRYLEELNALETNRTFCGEPLTDSYKLLIIGTFNPDDNSCIKSNNAEWFYGRKKNNLWRFLPRALREHSLHVNDRPEATGKDWREFCISHKIVIIDLIKRIEAVDPLPDFGDNEVEQRINADLSNTSIFNITQAFEGIKFDRVIYSLSWSDSKIKKIRKIRDIVNENLLSIGCIESLNQIRYPNSPARNDSYEAWNKAINN